MANSKEATSIRDERVDNVEDAVSLVKSGLDEKTTEVMYKKLKNEGKCCEGGSEGWTG